MEVKYIITFGNPVDGFNYCGPFDTADDAVQYANTFDDDGPWWVVELTPPDLTRNDGAVR